ncbi:MAG: FkbM family methyltransferase [Opitutales bacterium]|jgi:FkbM family methyltransferase
MNLRTWLKRPLYRTPRLLGALMRMKSNWSRETYVFLHAVRRGDFVLDVGANLGEFTELFARLVGPRGRVAAFEPVPPTYAQLTSRLRPWPRVSTYNVAVSDRPGEVLLNLPGQDCGQASLRPHHAGSWEGTAAVTQHRAQAVTLDQWSGEAQWPHIDFLKLDIEGAELLALRGASHLVKKYHPVIFVEVWQEWLKDFGFTPRDLALWLREQGYDRFLAVDDALTPLSDLEGSWAPHLARGTHNLLAGVSARHLGRWPGW